MKSLIKQFVSLRIDPDAMQMILNHAKNNDTEVMGWLAGEQVGDTDLITRAFPLDARVGKTFADAAPLDIKRAADQVVAQGGVLKGVYHSHVDSRVYHSQVDDETTARLLPAMVQSNLKRCPPVVAAPTILSQDEAVLPLEDGQHHFFTLLGSRVRGTDDALRSRWSRVTTEFHSKPFRGAIQTGDQLQLHGNGVTHTLGIPLGAVLQTRTRDCAAVRRAHMFSLVVNRRGERFAKALHYLELEQQTFIELDQCPVVAKAPNTCNGSPAGCLRPFDDGDSE